MSEAGEAIRADLRSQRMFHEPNFTASRGYRQTAVSHYIECACLDHCAFGRLESRNAVKIILDRICSPALPRRQTGYCD